MSVTIRDVNTNEEIIIPPEGLIFGRTGGDADIQLDDNSISRRQARVSLKGGNWLVETIAVAQGQRPPRPVTLVEGQTFIVGNNEFEVVSIAEADQEEEEQDAPPPKAAARAAAPAKPSRAPTMKTTPAAAPSKRPAAAAAPAKRAAPAASDGEEEANDSNEPAAKGFGAMFVAAPKGLAYYLVNVPKMLFNPLGTVRTAIEEQPAEPMGRIELIGYALPALLATGMLGSIAGGLALLIGPGHIFSLMSFIPIVPAISAVIGAVVTGFVFHPFMEWLIRFLKGESDARSRTNYFLQLMTLSIVLAVPNALGVILGSLPIPFINLIGPLLMTVASLVSIYVAYQWFLSFGVVKWFRTVLLVLGALSVLGAAYGLVMGVVHTIQGFGSHSTASDIAAADIATGDVDDATAKAIAEAEKAAGGAEMPEAARKALADAAKMRAELAKKGAAASAAAEEAAEKAEKAAEKNEKAEKPPKAEKAAVVKKEADPEPEPTITEEPVAKAPPPAAETKSAGKSSGYGEYARKRDLVEKAFANDPTVLAGSKDLQDAYGEYLKESSEIDKSFQKDIAKNANKARLYERLRDAELYQKTGKLVDQLAGKLKIH